LEASGAISNMREARLERRPQSIPDGLYYTMYALTLAASMAIWFFNIRAPLWLDETVSIYLIRGGFAGIISRQVWPDSPT
jgi:hypothetical protein